MKELYIAATLAATRLAVDEYREKVREAQLEAWERRNECCEEWA